MISIHLLAHRLSWMNRWMNQWKDYCTANFRPSIRPPALLDELMDKPMDGLLYRKLYSIYSSIGSIGFIDGRIIIQIISVHCSSTSFVGWTNGWIIVQKSFVHLFVHQLCWMNWWTNHYTDNLRPSICSPALLHEQMDEPMDALLYRKVPSIYSSTGSLVWTDGPIFTMKNFRPSTIQLLCWMNWWTNITMENIRPSAI